MRRTRKWGQQKPALGAQPMSGHPLGSKITSGYLFNEMGGTPAYRSAAASATPKWGARGIVNTAATDYWVSGIMIPTATTPGSLVGEWNIASGAGFWLSGFNNINNPWAPSVDLQIFGTDFFAGWRGNTGTDYRAVAAISSTPFAYNTRARAAVVWNTAGTKLYINGVLVATNGTPPLGNAMTQGLSINGAVPAALNPNGLVAGSGCNWIWYCDSALVADEVEEWHANPYSMIAPPGPRRTWFLPSSGVPIPVFMHHYRQQGIA